MGSFDNPILLMSKKAAPKRTIKTLFSLTYPHYFWAILALLCVAELILSAVICSIA